MASEWLHSLVWKLKALMHRRRLEEDLADELEFHLAMKAEQAKGEGAGEAEASAAARRSFGNPTLRKESLREDWTFAAIEGLWQDVRHAARALRKAPAFTTVAVASLAIGIGANTSIFTVFDTLFLRSLPVRNPHELRILNWTGKGKSLVRSSSGYGSSAAGVRTRSSFSFEAFGEIQKQGVFSAAGGFAPLHANVLVQSQAQIAQGQLVSGRYFETLGVEPALGRTLLPSDDSLDAPPAAVISWRLFQRLYNGDPGALGSAMRVDKTSYAVVGVLPSNFRGLTLAAPIDLYVPLARAEQLDRYSLSDPFDWWIQVVGRPAPGVPDSQVRAGVDVALSNVIRAHRGAIQKDTELRAIVIDGRSGLAFVNGTMREFLLVLLVMVGLVLLIACANVATLLVARSSSRSRELAIRLSLGAGRLRITRYLLTESLLVAFAGGVLGFLLAQAGTPLLAYVVFPDPEASVPLRPDARVLVFTTAISLLTALLFGLVPATRASGVQPALCLRPTGAGKGAVRQRLARVLVVAQLAVAIVLVAGAGLFTRTLVNLGRVQLGFRPGNLLLFYVEPKGNGYDDQRLRDVYRRIQEKLSSLPGVREVTLARHPLLTGWMSNNDISISGDQRAPGKGIVAYVHVVGSRFLTVMGTPILLGRDLEESDSENAPRAGIINSTLARKHFQGNPVGREFCFGTPFKARDAIRIVGVTADAKYDKIRNEVPPTVYVPWTQHIQRAHGMHFQLRTSVDALSIAPAVRQAVAEIDPALPIDQVRTQQQLIERATASERTFAALGAFFSGVSVILACIGVYGILAYAVARRTSEFGVRMALGATGAQIRWLVLKGTLVLLGAAVAIGAPSALASVRLVRSRLFGVEPWDPGTLTAAVLLLVLSGLIAAWIPSRRAARCDPSTALRYE